MSALSLFSLRAASTLRLVVVVPLEQVHIEVSLDPANVLPCFLIELVVSLAHDQFIDVNLGLVVGLTRGLELISINTHTAAVVVFVAFRHFDFNILIY